MSKIYEPSLDISSPIRDWLILSGALGLGLLMLYAVGFDQGFLLSFFQGHAAYQLNMIYELIHDSRHITAFPCH